MEKLFTITCTTCRARLAVRTESAIGAILECPKCDSMVHITPPDGWKPSPPPGDEPLPDLPPGLPPLDRVADSVTLELEPANVSLLGRLLHQTWLVWGIASPAALTAAVVVLWVFFSRHEPKPAALETEAPAAAIAQAAVDPASSARKPSAGDVGRRGTAEPASAPTALAAAARKTGEPSSKNGDPPVTQPAADAALYSSGPSPSPKTKSGRSGAPDTSKEPAEGSVDAVQTVEIKKAPPVRVEVAARLGDPVAQLELTDVPLVKVLDLLAAMSTLPITLDAEAMAQLGVTPRDPISLRLASVSVGKALQAVAASRGLAATAENGQVLITSPAEYRETLGKVRYTVSDLTGGEKDAGAELTAMVRRLVAPESWQGNGGRGTIETDAGAMVVVQTGDVHQQVLVFCEKLRTARQKPLRSRGDPQRFSLTTRLNQARKMLDQPVTANFHQPAPLAAVLAFLAGAVQGDILVDRAALAMAETSDGVEASLTVQKETLGAALAELLRPLGLAYRAIGANAIQVTTKEAAEERLELEFYPVGPRLAKGTSGPALAEQLRARVAASTWSEAGGAGEVYFDRPSQCLIVLQSQPAQAAVEQFLATKGEDSGGKAE